MSNYPIGQCTYFVAAHFDWIAKAPNLGNAKDWTGKWQELGQLVTSNPTLNSVACFQPGVDGADVAFGHVGICGAIAADGTFSVMEMNGPAGLGVVDTRNGLQVGPGVSFLLPPPKPTPKPNQSKETLDVIRIYVTDINPVAQYLYDGKTIEYIASSVDAQVLNEAAVPYVARTTAQVQEMGKPIHGGPIGA